MNDSLVLPAYFWMVSRSESAFASGVTVTGRSTPSPSSNSAYSEDRFDSSARSLSPRAAELVKRT